jgi:hypothetical protein
VVLSAGPTLDSYGGPQGPVYDSYGGPLNRVDNSNSNKRVDPRTPNSPSTTYSAGTEQGIIGRMRFVWVVEIPSHLTLFRMGSILIN